MILRALAHPDPAHPALSLQDVRHVGPDQHPAPARLNQRDDVVGDLTGAAHRVVGAAAHEVTVQSSLTF